MTFAQLYALVSCLFPKPAVIEQQARHMYVYRPHRKSLDVWWDTVPRHPFSVSVAIGPSLVPGHSGLYYHTNNTPDDVAGCLTWLAEQT